MKQQKETKQIFHVVTMTTGFANFGPGEIWTHPEGKPHYYWPTVTGTILLCGTYLSVMLLVEVTMVVFEYNMTPCFLGYNMSHTDTTSVTMLFQLHNLCPRNRGNTH